MAGPLRAVLVGAGGIAEHAHLPAVRALGGSVELVAVTDTDPSKAARLADRHGVPRHYADLSTMLDKESPDLALVATPSATHSAITVQCLDAGASVYCEKPLCASLAEHDEILAAERRSGRWCVPVFQWRAGSGARHLRDLLSAGSLGRPLLAFCHTLWYRDSDYYAVPWRGRRDTEIGGATTTQGIHAIDLLLWLFPDWEEVTARLATLDRPVETEDVSVAHVRFASGMLAGLASSVLSPAQSSSLRLDCRHGTVELEHLYAYRNADWTFTPAPGQGDLWNPPDDEPASHATHLALVVERLRAGLRPDGTAEDARRTVEFLTALYKSALTGTSVARGTIQPDDPFYRSVWG